MDVTSTNKQRMADICAALARGEMTPLLDAMADDFQWTVIGSTDWSGTYRGKRDVIDLLLTPLSAQFADRYTNTAHRLVAEDDYVVVECVGRVTTTGGKPYNNTYCWVCRFADGQLIALKEYCDTDLIRRTLTAPALDRD